MEPAVRPAGPGADPGQVAQPPGRGEQQRRPGPPAVAPPDDRQQRGQPHHRDQRRGGGPGQAGEQAHHTGGHPVPAQQRVQRPRGQRGEQALAVAHRLHDGVRHGAPERGEQDAGTPVVQVLADGVQAPGGGQRGQPRHDQRRLARAERGEPLQGRGQARVEREERHVALGLLVPVVAVLDDPEVPVAVGPGEPLDRGDVDVAGPQVDDEHADQPDHRVQRQRGRRVPGGVAQPPDVAGPDAVGCGRAGRRGWCGPAGFLGGHHVHCAVPFALSCDCPEARVARPATRRTTRSGRRSLNRMEGSNRHTRSWGTGGGGRSSPIRCRRLARVRGRGAGDDETGRNGI